MPSSGSTGTGLKHRKINENIKVIGRLCQLTTDYNVTLKLHREKNTFATKSHAYSFVLNHWLFTDASTSQGIAVNGCSQNYTKGYMQRPWGCMWERRPGGGGLCPLPEKNLIWCDCVGKSPGVLYPLPKKNLMWWHGDESGGSTEKKLMFFCDSIWCMFTFSVLTGKNILNIWRGRLSPQGPSPSWLPPAVVHIHQSCCCNGQHWCWTGQWNAHLSISNLYSGKNIRL